MRTGLGASAFDFVSFGSTLSIRSFVRLGSGLSVGRAANDCPAFVNGKMSIGQPLQFASSISLRGFGLRAGSSVSMLNFAEMGSSFSTRSFSRLGGSVSIYNYGVMGSALSVRGVLEGSFKGGMGGFLFVMVGFVFSYGLVFDL